jgi:putative FmdB family regulatory protein
MPTYEYACKSCGEHVEVVQSFKDEPLTECPACGGPLRKVFGSIGISFKGSGFYRTDSRKGADGKSDGAASKPSESGTASSSSASSSEKTGSGARSESAKSESSKSAAS